MRIAVKSPLKYSQEAGIIDEIGVHAAKLGKSALVLLTRSNYERMGERLRTGLEAAGCRCVFAFFSGEITYVEIDRVAGIALSEDCGLIIGAGGGRVLDTARAAADKIDCRLMIFPTTASSDAPCSAVAVIHDDNGKVVEIRTVRRNPDLVLVDTAIIAAAPARFMTAGIGDALATWYEARACGKKGIVTHAGGCSGRTAITLSKLCHDTLIELGAEAMAAVRRGEANDALEEVVHAAIYLSGFGFENGGVAACHAINEGFSVLPECQRILHGALVGFGILVQLELEGAPEEELRALRAFMKSVGLPTALCDLGLDTLRPEQLRAVAENACAAPPMKNMPFDISPDDVYAAILTADRAGRE